jgi:hypothetical protein
VSYTHWKLARRRPKFAGVPNQLILRLAELAPRLRPALLHRVISAYGLEDCAELVAQATPAQLSHVLDLDLWRPARPGLDEQFDAERFGVWIEVLLEAGADLAADKLSQLPSEQLVAGFAHHARVFDIAAIASYETTDAERIESRALGDELAREIGGYHVAARREDAWDAIVAVLMSLAARHHGRFDELMSALRSLSNSRREPDGLHPLLESRDQMLFDVASERERRRERHGFASPAQARAFLQMSRGVGPGAVPPPNPIARAYFRSIDTSPRLNEGPARRDEADVEAAELLAEAGVLPEQAPRGLLTGGQDQSSSRLAHMHRHMQLVLERDPAAYGERNAELAYLANVLMAGASIQSRPFTAQEALGRGLQSGTREIARSVGGTPARPGPDRRLPGRMDRASRGGRPVCREDADRRRGSHAVCRRTRPERARDASHHDDEAVEGGNPVARRAVARRDRDPRPAGVGCARRTHRRVSRDPWRVDGFTRAPHAGDRCAGLCIHHRRRRHRAGPATSCARCPTFLAAAEAPCPRPPRGE